MREHQLITLFDYVRAGGWVEVLILLLSVAAIVGIVDCFLKTRQGVAIPLGFLSELRRRLSAEGPSKAAVFCAGQSSLLAEPLRVGLRRVKEGISVMEGGAYQALEEGLASLHARLALPLATAIIAPLLGLLGGALRLVQIFGRMLSSAPPAAPEVARGVVGALIPLATGLIVSAIVASFYFYLRRRIVKLGVAASALLREILEEGYQRREHE